MKLAWCFTIYWWRGEPPIELWSRAQPCVKALPPRLTILVDKWVHLGGGLTREQGATYLVVGGLGGARLSNVDAHPFGKELRETNLCLASLLSCIVSLHPCSFTCIHFLLLVSCCSCLTLCLHHLSLSLCKLASFSCHTFPKILKTQKNWLAPIQPL
jgi:hypothetical protein